jgi:hypothetical protein
MDKRKLLRVAKTFEQDDYDIPQALEWYVGIDTPTIEGVRHPDNLWTILDRIETIVMEDSEVDGEQEAFLHHFIGKWKKEIEPYCVRWKDFSIRI